jgi:hypothetical protein
MLSANQRRKVKEEVVKAYKEKYPIWQSVSVTEIVENIYFGTMVSVRSDESPDGEICVYTKDGIIIFDTTPELVRYLDMKARSVVSLRDWLTMIVVLVTLGLFVAVVFNFEKPEAIGLVVTAMAGILGAYAGVHIKGAASKE